MDEQSRPGCAKWEHQPRVLFWTVLIGGVLCTAMLSLCVGSVPLTPAQLWRAVCGEEGTAARILWHVRLPRMCATMLCGSALAVSGAVIQNVLDNPLASPSIIGVNAGAGMGAVLCMAFLPTVPGAVPLASFAGALGAMLLVYVVARKAGASRMTLVLAGVAVNAMLNACVDVVITVEPNAIDGLNDFRIGGVAGVLLRNLSPACYGIAFCLVLVCFFHTELDVLCLGDETAASLGLRTEAYRLAFLVLACALAGMAVSFAGLIGFVGLVVPHIVRRCGMHSSAQLLPACILGGAAFLTVCDIGARWVARPYEIPVGVVLALLGGPFFLLLILRRRRHD